MPGFITIYFPFALMHSLAHPGANPAAQATSTIPSSLNLSVPGAPALDILGIDASKATQPTSLQQAAWSLINNFDKDGKAKNGIAYTATLVQLGLASKQVDLGRYYGSGHWLDRALYKTQFSLGVGKADDTTQGVSKAAFGFSMPLIDQTDWRGDSDLLKEFRTAVAKLKPPRLPVFPADDVPAMTVGPALEQLATLVGEVAGVDVDAGTLRNNLREFADDLLRRHPTSIAGTDLSTLDSLRSRYEALQKSVASTVMPGRQKKIDDIVKGLNSRSWNRLKIDIAGAGATQTEGATAFSSNGYGTWMTVSAPLGRSSQMLFYAKYFNKIFMKLGDMTTPADLTGLTLAGRIRGGSSTDGYFAEFQYQEGKPTGGAKVFDRTFQGGIEHKIGDQWLQIGIGKSLKGGHKFVFGLDLAFDTSPKRTLDDQGGPAQVLSSWPTTKPMADPVGVHN